MGYGPIKNGKHTAITPFIGSWAYEEMKKQLEATEIRHSEYAVRPKGALGTHDRRLHRAGAERRE